MFTDNFGSLYTYVLYTYVSVVRSPLIVLDNVQMASEGPQNCVDNLNLNISWGCHSKRNTMCNYQSPEQPSPAPNPQNDLLGAGGLISYNINSLAKLTNIVYGQFVA